MQGCNEGLEGSKIALLKMERAGTRDRPRPPTHYNSVSYFPLANFPITPPSSRKR
jgi:hypothetical protein